MSPLLGINIYAQINPFWETEGIWIFEKAEYLEKTSPTQDYQVKFTMNKEDELYSLEQCYSNLVKSASFHGNIATMECLYTKYYGKYVMEEIGVSAEKQIHLIVGDPEELGLEYAPDIKFNAPGLNYLIDKLNDDTIRITVENICHEEAAVKYGAVRCILKKNK